MIDHITLHVSNAERSIAFYTKALSPLGYIPKAHHEPTIGFGVDDGTPRSDFYISPMDDPAQQPIPTHIGFRATNEQAVRDFYEAAITAGGMDNGRPGPRAYHSGYYAACGCMTNLTIAGIFPAGGDAKFGLMCDAIVMWLIVVPVGLLAAFVFKLPVLVVYALLNTDECIKMVPALLHYRKYRWLRNVTR